jgi:hypothetical protein
VWAVGGARGGLFIGGQGGGRRGGEHQRRFAAAAMMAHSGDGTARTGSGDGMA